KLDEATYRLIGTAYAEVEAKEPWCANVTPVADVGVLSYEAVSGIQASRQAVTGNSAHIANGVVRVLQEGHILYDVLDTECDFSKYQVIVLPDAIQLNNELRLKLQQYLDNGGKVFATGSSAIDTERGEFMLDFGAKYLGEGEYNPVYVAPRFPLQSWAPAGFVVYSNAQQLELAGGETIADLQNPFFNRDYLHFCSHMHAPSTGIDAGPAMVRTANSCYFAVPAFQLYFLSGQTVLRDIILAGIRALLVEPTLETSLPSQGINSVMRQESEKRTVVHLLYGTPVKRGQQIPTLGINSIEVIEDLVPIYNVQVALRADKAPSQVYLAPQGDVVEFSYECGIIKTTIPQVECHQMLVVQD
ncbi:MAG: beta-galactosidase trimerization domain-containing protein, partial [bacterium]